MGVRWYWRALGGSGGAEGLGEAHTADSGTRCAGARPRAELSLPDKPLSHRAPCAIHCLTVLSYHSHSPHSFSIFRLE